jgi:hypothetical protein
MGSLSYGKLRKEFGGMPTGPDLIKTSHLISVEGTEAEVEQLIQYSEAEGISLNRLSPNDAMLKYQDMGTMRKWQIISYTTSLKKENILHCFMCAS